MSSEQPTIPPEPRERRGAMKVLEEVRDVVAGPPGRRGYDKKRVGMLVALLAIVQFGVQTGAKLIDKMFDAYKEVATTQAVAERQQRHQEHLESLEVQRSTARAIEKLADEVKTNSETVRRAVWGRGGTVPDKGGGGKDGHR